MSWFRSFIRRHLVADDAATQYSRLDHFDGLKETPVSSPTSGEKAATAQADVPKPDAQDETLAAIQARAATSRSMASADADALLAIVRDQQGRLDRVADLARYLDTLTPGAQRYAELIRAALAEGEEA
ncbi:hypothetical protein [Arthrobacter sp. NPDC058192]|uniref:hypothetical protein n=1 Tax=Arthrobacter sp. NPDC058192 TaxID=3346372 RepID=UPI0036EF6B2B